jgi:hypothetical protein
MRGQHIQAIREACINANPAILIREHCGGCECLPQNYDVLVCLADVLLAMQATTTVKGSTLINSYGIFMDTHFNMKFENAWNLRNDTLDAQSDECLRFLANLLQ